jgi:phosphoesterase RecJ-like protein
MNVISQKIHAHLLQARKTIIIPHQNPDGDAIGSATALLEFMEQNSRPAEIFCVTPLPTKFTFVPHSHRIQNIESIVLDHSVDTVVVLDSGDLRYAGVDRLLHNHHATIINIDHHPTNENYGHYNLVIPTAASTTEVLYHFFKSIRAPINNRLATALLTGLTTDTDNFTNAATKSDTLQIASELIHAGGNLNLINNKTVKNKNVNTLKLWGTVLSRLEKHPETNITYTYILQSDLEELGVDETESEGIANFLNRLDDTPIALILKEAKNGKIKGSFRTTEENADVSALAKIFSGGGHKKAAGFTTDGTIQSVWKKINEELKKKEKDSIIEK